uniref:Ribosomal protein S18 n=1 Tax=Timema monikensis TaxID=170555 RepID=A0A7R9HRS9_9NEOP|nr:unnamed protein product [Timema monikensis]
MKIAHDTTHDGLRGNEHPARQEHQGGRYARPMLEYSGGKQPCRARTSGLSHVMNVCVSTGNQSTLNSPTVPSSACYRFSQRTIRESHQGKVLTIEGVLVPSPREQYLVRPEHEGVCSLCSIGVDVKHTDVLILSQFLRADGCMLPRRVTGLCKNQQKRISILVQMAQKAGLMPNLGPANSKKDPKLRYRWKKFNTYFDESTIKPFRYQNVEKSAAVQIQSF